MKSLFYCLAFLCVNTLIAQIELPSITLKDLNGKDVSLATLSKDKTIVVSLWATWCVPCMQELDAIAAQYDTLQKDTGFELVAINVDDARSVRRVKPKVDSKAWKYLILLDTANEVRNYLKVKSIPYTMIIKDGKIKYRHASYTKGSENELVSKFKKIANSK